MSWDPPLQRGRNLLGVLLESNFADTHAEHFDTDSNSSVVTIVGSTCREILLAHISELQTLGYRLGACYGIKFCVAFL